LPGTLQSVILENHKSDPLDVVSGVPQGTVMGPLLFLACINDLPEATSSRARLVADDCLLFDVINGNKELTFARSIDSESMLLITKDLVTIEVVHDGTMDNVLR
jgi:hypothetical protein